MFCLVKIEYVKPGSEPDYVIMSNDDISSLFAGILMQDGQIIQYQTNNPHVHFAAQCVEVIENEVQDAYRLKSHIYPGQVWNVDIHNDQVMRAYIVMKDILVDRYGYIEARESAND